MQALTARKLLFLSAPLALGLAGCGATSGIIPVGPGMYVVSEMRAEALGGGARAREVVLAEAAGFCHQQGRGVSILDLQPGGDPRGHYWPTAFDATFQCVAAPSEDGGRTGIRTPEPGQ